MDNGNSSLNGPFPNANRESDSVITAKNSKNYDTCNKYEQTEIPTLDRKT